MGYEMIIAEKPSAAKKIAEALSDRRPKKKIYKKKISYFEAERNGRKIVVVSAVGHLYTVAEKEKKGWTYPVFDVVWRPTYESDKAAKYTKDYLDLIRKLCNDASTITVATDYDIEGEVIGLNIVKYGCNKKDARRMKFSTTTKDDLINAYEHASRHLDWLQAEAGLTRHELDYYYGINLSRALTLAIKSSGTFKIMSSGRVQGPALKILADKEEEIRKFVPKKYWEIELVTNKISAWHKKGKFWEKNEAERAASNAEKNKKAIVTRITVKKHKQDPPHPFDLTSLQTEAYRHHKIQPKKTLEIAQELYVNSYISYPRTSSNQLPPSVNYKKIIQKIAKQKKYESICRKLLSTKDIKPNNGKKKDPAHPACYPTGEIPKNLSDAENKIYDLIVRRTLASFGEPAERETVTIEIEAGRELFSAKGTRTVKKGWHELYGKYAKFEENEMPVLEEGEELKIKKVNVQEKETQPPKRYTPASIIGELEKRGLGTKATRAQIIENLTQRNYVTGTPLKVTDLGLKTVKTLMKYCPEILDEELTRKFEEEMEEIRKKKSTKGKILENACKVLTRILNKFKKQEKKIGKELAEANRETQYRESVVGKCDKCKEGMLRIMYSKRFKSRFIACDKYPECKNTFSLPAGLPKATGKQCPECGYPLVQIIRAGKRPFLYCINRDCPKKKEWIERMRKRMEEPENKSSGERGVADDSKSATNKNKKAAASGKSIKKKKKKIRSR